jgi:hypothetical protein
MAIKNQYGRTPEYVVDNLKITSTDATVGGTIVLTEGRDNGSHTMTVKAPDSLSGDVTITLPSSGTIGDVSASSTTTFTNKTLNCDSTGNVVTNIGSSEVKSELITGQSAVSAAVGDYVMISDESDSNNLKKATVQSIVDLAGGGGGGGMWSYLATGTISTAYMTFLGLSANSRYKLSLWDLEMASPANIYLEVSVDNGANWLTSGFFTTANGSMTTTSNDYGNATGTAIIGTTGALDGTGIGMLEMNISTKTNKFLAGYKFDSQDFQVAALTESGTFHRASTVNAVRFRSDANITGGAGYIYSLVTS